MSSSFPEPTESFLVVPFLGGEDLRADGPYINPVLLSAPIGDSTLEATVRDKQGRTTLHYGDEAFLPSRFHHPCIQLGPQPNLLNYVARTHETGGLVTIQATQDRRNVNRRARAICTDCNKGFGRAQELSRHRKDVHEQPRYCLFCGFKWTRPINIKTHLLTRHRGNFTVELLVTIQALRGRMIVAFLDGYDEGSGVEGFSSYPEQLTGSHAFTNIIMPFDAPAA